MDIYGPQSLITFPEDLMLISPAWAQAAGAPGGDIFMSLMPLILIFVVFWFLLIRPQQQKMKQHRQMIENLKKGDQVVTAGGIIGKITRLEQDNTLQVEIAPNVQVKVARGTISDLLSKPQPASNENRVAPSQAGGGTLLNRILGKK
jgi:preprotein translocase subunit YajC